MISYVLEVANYGKEVIRVVCDDIDDCVRLTRLLGVRTTAGMQSANGTLGWSCARYHLHLR